MTAVAACAGILGVPAPVNVAHRQPGFVQIIAHPDDDLLFMSPDLPHDIRAGGGATTVVLTAAEGRAGIKPDTHNTLAYAAERRQGLHAAYAAMAGMRDSWRIQAVRSGRVKVELHSLTGRPAIQLAFLSLPDGRDPRANLGRRALAQIHADRDSKMCARTVTPTGSPYASCYTRKDVVGALVTLLRRSKATAVRAQDPAPDRRYTADHTDHAAASAFAAEAVRASGRRMVEVDYRDYNLSDMPVNLDRADSSTKQQIFGRYRAHDYRINPEAANYGSWQERMRYRWPRGTSWATRMPDGRPQAFAVLSGGLYTWWNSPSGWKGPAALGGGPLAPSLAVGGGQVFALRDGQVVAARPLLSHGKWSARWTTVGSGAAGAPVVAAGRGGRPVVFVRDPKGGVSVKCQASGGSWPKKWLQLRGPAGRDVQDGMAAVGGSAGVELFAPTRTQVLQWRQTSACGFTYAGAIPGVRPGSPLNASRDAGGHPTLVYEDGGLTTVRQVQETGRTWTTPTRRLGAVFERTGEAPVPTGGTMPPALGVPAIGVPIVAAYGNGKAAALALGADGRMYVSARGTWGTFGAWQPAG
jgi:LmbE family N-acetylglucosaminyl deacetylase